MNQSILFGDELRWDEQQRCVIFTAQSMGALLECIVPAELLEELAGKPVVEQTEGFSVFNQFRFDLEETAEQLIEDEEYDSQGRVVVNTLN
jgi:hypothetical protein